MVEIINKYETLFVVDASKSEEEITALVDKFKSLIEANGTIESVTDWGKRRLEYPINDMNEGYYTIVFFKAGAEFPAELERLYGIDEKVMRSIVIKHDEKVLARAKERAAARAAAKAAREAAKAEAEAAEAEAVEAPVADAE